jgi:hypothetical protein
MVSATRAKATRMAGRPAWGLTIVDGDDFSGERAEFGQDGDGSRIFHNGDELWLGDAVYMPPGFPTDVRWTVFNQWKDIAPDLGSPTWSINVERGQIGLWNVSRGWIGREPARTGVWQNYVVHMKLTTDSSGFAVVYWSTGDDVPVQIGRYDGVTYRGAAEMVPRMGYYRDPAISSTDTVYHAGVRVGDSFDAVDPVP